MLLPDEEERDRIVRALDRALEDARAFGRGDQDEFRELVKRCREMHDILLAAMLAHTRLNTADLTKYAAETRDQIRELEQLAGTSSRTQH